MTAPTIGSLCSGYAGLDLAAEQVMGGTTVWHCENEAAPSKLLALRFLGVPNHHDVKALTWAEHPVDVLTGGYPCQPFSGAGKRLGTDDTRHLFPWIAEGVARMRPPLLLLENVRGHLSLGFDVVLAELHRLDYDVRWTILPASAVGAPHGRARLWIAARAREAGGWPMPLGEPMARLEGDTWVEVSDSLFGSVPLPRNDKGSVPMWPSGVLVESVAWSSPTLAAPSALLLPTPRATRGGRHSETRDLLMPTPRSTDSNGPGEHGDGGLDLRTAVSLLPTPQVSDPDYRSPESAASRAEQGFGDLAGTVLHRLLLAPRATDGTKGGPNQRDSGGDLMLPSAVQLLPTPASMNAAMDPGSLESWNARNERERAKDRNGNGMGTPLGIAIHPEVMGDAWGRYAAAVARWEALTRPAPAPTEQGRSGPRLSPAFVEWLMGLPEGWVTGVPGLTRNQQLTALGNGVVPMQAAAAYRLLGVAELFCEVAA